MNLLHSLYDRLERKLLIGNNRLQWLFERLHRFSLRGMNYDQTHAIERSGELFVLEYIRQTLPDAPGLTIFDVGANRGIYARHLSSKFPHASIYSFEPYAPTYNLLLSNVKQCKNVGCYNLALGARKEQRPFYADSPGSTLASFYPAETIDQNKMPTRVDLIDLDTFCRDNNILKIDLLKIDVEGFELDVLKGASGMLTDRKIKYIQFEFGPNHIESGTRLKDIFEILSSYAISRITRNGLRRVSSYDKILEIYLSANYLAELRPH